MKKVKITIVSSSCRALHHKEGEEFVVEDMCPNMCHELWHAIYPFVYTLLNGGELDYKNGKSKSFDMKCPDEGRVIVHGEVIED